MWSVASSSLLCEAIDVVFAQLDFAYLLVDTVQFFYMVFDCMLVRKACCNFTAEQPGKAGDFGLLIV